MRDVVKNNYPAQRPSGRMPPRKRRKRNYSLYYLMIFILVAAVGIVLSLTVFFKVSKINVNGKTRYDTNSIVAYSKIKIGENIFRADYDLAKKNILKNLIYIDDVTITKTLSCEVDIAVEPSIPIANIQYDDGYLLVSKGGKILEDLSAPQEGIRVISGFQPKKPELGERIVSENEDTQKLMQTLCNMLDKLEMTQVQQVDVTDPFNIALIYENRIRIELGSISDLEYKMTYANELIKNKINKNKEGTLFMLGDNEASFVEKRDLEKYQENYQTAVAGSTASVTTTASQTESSSDIDNSSAQ